MRAGAVGKKIGTFARAFTAGAALFALACGQVHAQEGLLLYVPNLTSGNVSVFRTQVDGGLTPVATVSGLLDSRNVALRGDQAFAYVSSSAGNALRVINTANHTVVQTIATGLSQPLGVAVSPDGRLVYVANNGGPDNTVSVFSANPLNGQLTTAGTVATGALNAQPRAIAFSPDGARAFIVNQAAGTVAVVNTGTSTIFGTVTLGGTPLDVRINSAGTRAYVSATAGQVHVIDLATNTLLTTVVTPGANGNGNSLVVTADGTRVFVASNNLNSVQQVDATNNTALLDVASGSTSGIAITPDGRFVFVPQQNFDNVNRFSVRGGVLVDLGADTPAGVLPIDAALCANGNRMLAAGATFVANTAAALGCAGATPTFTGGTLLVNGTGLVFSSAMTLGAGGGMVDTNGNDATVSGAISGAGSLTKAGADTLTLSGANIYSGATMLTAGMLQAGAANTFSPNSAMNVAAGATLNLAGFAQSIGSLAGAGSVTLGAATLTAGGDNTSTTFSGVSSGTGGLAKAGTGTLTLLGANTYTGATMVNAGTLAVNGSLASAVTANNGGTLQGTGTIGGASIMSGGVFAPGNSIGTMTVNGNVAFAADSIFRVEADAAGNADRVNVSGTATISGGTVDVQAVAGSYQKNTVYTILNAAGGVSGAFAGATSNLAFLTPSLFYDANNVRLALTRNETTFAATAATPNQRAVAAHLDLVTRQPGVANLINSLESLSAARARQGFDSVGGASLVALRRAGAAFAGGFGQQLNRRLGLVASGDTATRMAGFDLPVQLAANDWMSDARPIYAQAPQGGGAAGSGRSRDGRGFWLRAYGTDQETNSDGNAAGSRLRGGGLSFGADTEVRDGLVLGIAGTAGRSRVSVDGTSDSGRSRGAALGAYASYAAGPWTFKGIGGLAWNDNHMDRTIVAGAPLGTASSDFDSRSASLYGEATYDIAMRGITLQPLAAFSWVRTKNDGFTEQGAGALNLLVAAHAARSERLLLGAKAIHEAGNIRIEPRVLWAHEFGNLNAPMNASLSGAPAAGNFTVSGVALKRDSVILGLGLSGNVKSNVALFADAQLEHNVRQSTLGAFAGVRATW